MLRNVAHPMTLVFSNFMNTSISMSAPNGRRRAFLVGGGIASLSAAVLLIRDGGFQGTDIFIFEEMQVAGGALDGSGDAEAGYVTRGGRMWTEEAYVCLWNVLDSVPDRHGAGSLKDAVWDFNEALQSHANARLIDRQHRILDAADLGFDARDRLDVLRLLATPERMLGAERIEDCFTEHFFNSNFWAMWRTTFAFQNWHSAVEMRRYLLRFLQELPRIHTLAGVRRTALNQYDSIVRPMQDWLAGQGVAFQFGTKVVDMDFEDFAEMTEVARNTDGLRVTAIHCNRGDEFFLHQVGTDDLVFATLGSMTADTRIGDNDHAPALLRDKRDGGWTLWENLARKVPTLGRPETFNGNVDESKWESFTVTLRSPLLVKRIEAYSGNGPGTGGLMTFKDSPWLMSIVVPHAPHFAGQPEGVYTIWGYGLFIDKKGDYVDKSMAESSGEEILTELMHQLGFEDILEEVRRTSTVIPVMLPYITSQFERREPTDRPAVVPGGTRNFAVLGQYVEIPEDVVFTVEFSVRSAMHAVYGLLHLKNEIPAIYHGAVHPKVALESFKALML